MASFSVLLGQSVADIGALLPLFQTAEPIPGVPLAYQPAAVLKPTKGSYKHLPAKHDALHSMSRRGNCYDNAHAQSFWSRFNAELLDGGNFPGLVGARLET